MKLIQKVINGTKAKIPSSIKGWKRKDLDTIAKQNGVIWHEWKGTAFFHSCGRDCYCHVGRAHLLSPKNDA